jgi:hypothetical protein
VFPVSSVFGYACGFDEEGDQLSAATVTEAVARWMVEAATLLAIGKPSDSPITLVFDSETITEQSSTVFDSVLRDSTWQLALDDCYRRRLLPVPAWFKRRTQQGYIYEDLTRLLEEMDSVNAPIRCNFVVRGHFDEENIISERRDDTIEEWENAWFIASQRDFQTIPPLPSWHIIRAGHVIPIAI